MEPKIVEPLIEAPSDPCGIKAIYKVGGGEGILFLPLLVALILFLMVLFK